MTITITGPLDERYDEILMAALRPEWLAYDASGRPAE